MLGWALTFLVVALIAAVLGFGGIAGTAIEIAKIIFFSSPSSCSWSRPCSASCAAAGRPDAPGPTAAAPERVRQG
ncbi:DUF1328 domain-containing protein [Ancylobacter dichloromethanicus]